MNITRIRSVFAIIALSCGTSAIAQSLEDLSMTPNQFIVSDWAFWVNDTSIPIYNRVCMSQGDITGSQVDSYRNGQKFCGDNVIPIGGCDSGARFNYTFTEARKSHPSKTILILADSREQPFGYCVSAPEETSQVRAGVHRSAMISAMKEALTKCAYKPCKILYYRLMIAGPGYNRKDSSRGTILSQWDPRILKINREAYLGL